MFLIVVGICLALFHTRLLQAAYEILVVDEPAEGCRYAMLVTRTPQCYDKAAQLLSENQVDQLWIVTEKPLRAVRFGALPPVAELAAKQLAQRGVAPNRYRVITTQAITSHQLFRELDVALAADEHANCLVISTTTLSRYTRNVIDQALAADRADHYRLLAVSPKTLDASNWWRSRDGVRRVLNHGLRLVFVLCSGESEIDLADPYDHLSAHDATG